MDERGIVVGRPGHPTALIVVVAAKASRGLAATRPPNRNARKHGARVGRLAREEPVPPRYRTIPVPFCSEQF